MGVGHRSQAGMRPGTREALRWNLKRLWKVTGKKRKDEKKMGSLFKATAGHQSKKNIR